MHPAPGPATGGATRRQVASWPRLQPRELKLLFAAMNSFLTIVLAVAVLAVPLACAYVIVLRLARRRKDGDN
jgi:hypothetical protein